MLPATHYNSNTTPEDIWFEMHIFEDAAGTDLRDEPGKENGFYYEDRDELRFK